MTASQMRSAERLLPFPPHRRFRRLLETRMCRMRWLNARRRWGQVFPCGPIAAGACLCRREDSKTPASKDLRRRGLQRRDGVSQALPKCIAPRRRAVPRMDIDPMRRQAAKRRVFRRSRHPHARRPADSSFERRRMPWRP